MEDYTVFESGGVVTLVVSVMEGNIRTSIIVSLSTINGSALGEFTGLTLLGLGVPKGSAVPSAQAINPQYRTAVQSPDNRDGFSSH